jgi:hypothetical protein
MIDTTEGGALAAVDAIQVKTTVDAAQVGRPTLLQELRREAEKYNFWAMRFVLEHGRHYTKAWYPIRYRRALRYKPAGSSNTLRLVKLFPGELRFVEGYASSIRKSWICPHAWAIDASDRVVDPTLMDDGMEYFGVELDLEFVTQSLDRQWNCRSATVLAELNDKRAIRQALVTDWMPKTVR